jgi:hypothetical protein
MHSINDLPLPPLTSIFRCRGLCGWRQVRRKDLLWFAGPALSADRGAALLDGDEAAVGPPAVVIDSTLFIWSAEVAPIVKNIDAAATITTMTPKNVSRMGVTQKRMRSEYMLMRPSRQYCSIASHKPG